jgi:serine/threonine protein kinase
MPIHPGDIVSGKYRVEHVLGEGGMGIVVAARHLELEELYAIKVMKREALGDDARAEQRFLGEARATARLKGEHVARVHDIGRLETGELYMVMEHLQGTDLKNVLRKRGPLPVQEAITYVLQTCEAIAEAHALDIIHRDLKPHNLFLTEGRNSIKVLDFGISKQRTAEAINFTGTNVVLGTLSYMSPEQMKQSKLVNARSDIWSIGVVLYELVTGKLPFPGESILEIFNRVTKEPPRPPSQLHPGLPAAVDAVVERCLEKNPARRFSSVAELAMALRSLLATPSASIATPSASIATPSTETAPPALPAPPSPKGAAVLTDSALSTQPTPTIDHAAAQSHHESISETGSDFLPGGKARRAWQWASVLGLFGFIALMIAAFNGGLRRSTPASRPGEAAHVATEREDVPPPSAIVPRPSAIAPETSPDAGLQPPNEPPSSGGSNLDPPVAASNVGTPAAPADSALAKAKPPGHKPHHHQRPDAPRSEPRSRCSVAFGDTFSTSVDVSGYTIEQRSQFISQKRCDGDPASTQLCCANSQLTGP